MTDERTIGEITPVTTLLATALVEIEQGAASFSATIQQIIDAVPAIKSINADTTGAQILAGTAGRISLVDAGATHTFDIDSAYVGQSSITTLGTITTGVWNGTSIAIANIAFGTANQIIKTNAGGTALEFGLIGDVNTATFTTTKISTLSKSLLNSALIYSDQNNSLGAFYLDIDDIAVPANPGVGVRRVFVDTATGELSVRTNGGATVSLETQGGAQTPWTSDIDAANNSLSNLDILEFGILVDTPTAGNAEIYWNGSSMKINVPAGDAIDFTVNDSAKLTIQTTGETSFGFNSLIRVGLLAFDADSLETISVQTNDMIFDVTTGDFFSFDVDGTPSVTIAAAVMTLKDAFDLALNTTTGTKIGTATNQKIGFWNATPVVQPTGAGADLTNSVTVGGTNNTIADFTDLSTYANDAAAIRNDIFQLARSLKFLQDSLRLMGLQS